MARYIDAAALLESIKSKRLIFEESTPVEEAIAEQISVLEEAIEESPTADVVPKSEIATQLIDEILEGLYYEIDREDTLGRKAWEEGDIRSYQLHQYVKVKLEMLKIALTLFQDKYTDKKDGDE